MYRFFGVSRSGYDNHVNRLGKKEKYHFIAERPKQQQDRYFFTYGYRRMQIWLDAQRIYRNPKRVLRIMKKYGIVTLTSTILSAFS